MPSIRQMKSIFVAPTNRRDSRPRVPAGSWREERLPGVDAGGHSMAAVGLDRRAATIEDRRQSQRHQEEDNISHKLILVRKLKRK